MKGRLRFLPTAVPAPTVPPLISSRRELMDVHQSCRRRAGGRPTSSLICPTLTDPLLLFARKIIYSHPLES